MPSKISIFVSTALILSSTAPALATKCATADTVITALPTTQKVECVTKARCMLYDMNTETGVYENYLGYHDKCPGHGDRQITDYTCKRADGSTYVVKDTSPVAKCEI
jgi:hypothetical protein